MSRKYNGFANAVANNVEVVMMGKLKKIEKMNEESFAILPRQRRSLLSYALGHAVIA